MTPKDNATVARLAEAETISRGPLSHYQNLIGAASLPLFTGVQTCKPGFQTPEHSHPYPEYLFIIDGVMEAWLVGREDEAHELKAGDIIVLPANIPHAFRNPGPMELRLLGIHVSPERIVHLVGSDQDSN